MLCCSALVWFSVEVVCNGLKMWFVGVFGCAGGPVRWVLESILILGGYFQGYFEAAPQVVRPPLNILYWVVGLTQNFFSAGVCRLPFLF